MKYFLKKFRGALITGLVFIVLLGFIFFRGSDEKQPEITTSDTNIFLEDGEILSVEIYYPTSWFLFERDDDNWFLVVDDLKVRANARVINELIVDVKNTDIIGTVPTDEVDLDQFGLESAKAEIVLITEEDNNHFIVGDNIPVGSGTYVYDPNEKTVFVVEKDYLDKYMDLSILDFRERGLFSFNSDAVNRISIWSGNFSVDVYKEQGEWIIDGQEDALVDNKIIDEIFWIFSRAKVADFEDETPENLKKYGLDDPVAEIRFYEDDRIEGLSFGKRKDEDNYYIKSDSDDKVYTIHKSLFKRVPKNLDQITLK